MMRGACIVAFIGLAVSARPARAQSPPVRAQVGIEALEATHMALEGEMGIIVPAGIYVRTSLIGASGTTWSNGTTRSVSRVELVSRFLLDPFREAPFGLSLGGGIGITNASGGSRWRPYLALVTDLELSRAGGWTPAIQTGLGGGVRLGLVLRSASDRWR
jgi:hypothetical protein